jgi:hypothetical protein
MRNIRSSLRLVSNSLYIYIYGSFLVLSLVMVNLGTNSFKEGKM